MERERGLVGEVGEECRNGGLDGSEEDVDVDDEEDDVRTGSDGAELRTDCVEPWSVGWVCTSAQSGHRAGAEVTRTGSLEGAAVGEAQGETLIGAQ